MCYVKTGEAIKTEQDVQNLVTAIILRQQRAYTKEYLVKATTYFMPQDKEIANAIADEARICYLIDNTLSVLHRNGQVKNYDDIYSNVEVALCP